jgi:hypothetical protein
MKESGLEILLVDPLLEGLMVDAVRVDATSSLSIARAAGTASEGGRGAGLGKRKLS